MSFSSDFKSLCHWRKPVVVVLERPKLNDEQMTAAFAVSPTTLWFLAVQQRIEFMRQESADNAAKHTSRNNALAASGGNGAYEILTSLMLDLEEQRRAAVAKKS